MAILSFTSKRDENNWSCVHEMSPEACNHVYMDKCVDDLKYHDTNPIDYICDPQHT